MLKKKIMCVDDDQDFLEEVSGVLTSKGYDVHSFSEGADALESVTKIIPDLILLDLNMDKVSGFQVADRLRRSPSTRDIPIIAMSGFFKNGEHSVIMKICGIGMCLEKPFHPEDMIKKIEEVLKKGGTV